MNLTKMKSVLLAAACFSAINLQAQNDQIVRSQADRSEQRAKLTPEQKAQKITDRMTEKLGLSPQQQSEVYRITLDGINKRRNHHERMRAEINAQMKTTLTAEQYQKFLKGQEKRAERRKGGKNEGPRRQHPRPTEKH